MHDFRYALRQLAKSPGYTAVAILMLALGIGATTAIFSVVHALLLAPLQYHDADQLVQVQSRHPEQGAAGMAPATFTDLVRSNASFSTFAAQYYYYVNLTGTETPALLNSGEVTADFFKLFNVAPSQGRVWTLEETTPAASPVVVLSNALWRAQFHASNEVIGQELMLDGVAHTVIGVMPASFKDPSETAQFWRPMRAGRDNPTDRSSRYWTVFARRKADVSLERANLELTTFARQLALDHPENYKGWTLQAADLRSLVVGDYHTGLLVMLGAVACVMLITCANIAGLSVARAASRRKEFAIRSALGSSRFQLLRQLLTETLLLSALGAIAGVLLATWGVDALIGSLPEGWMPRTDEVGLNVYVLGAAAALSVVTGLIAGLAPGFTASRIDANDALKQNAHGSRGPSAGRLRSALVISEIALALVILAGTGVLGRSFLGLLRTSPGLDAGRVLSLTVSLPASQYDSPSKCWDFLSRAEREIAALPGVEAAGFTHTSPFRWGIPFSFTPIDRNSGLDHRDLPQAFSDSVSVDFFKALGIPLRAGRTFTPADNHLTRPIVVINETAARRYFGAEDPLGRSLTADGGKTKFEVVGVVGDVRRSGLTAEAPMQVYRPLAQRTPPFATLMVRTALSPTALAKPVQAALWRIDPAIPVSDVAAMETYVSRSVTQPRLYFTLFSLFAFLALILAAIGLYGLMAHGVEQRTREFGIRTALGAGPGKILSMVVQEGARLIILGLCLGMMGSLALVGLLRSMVFGTSLHDPLVFIGAPLVLGAITIVACVIPARRATKADPLIALRAE